MQCFYITVTSWGYTI